MQNETTIEGFVGKTVRTRFSNNGSRVQDFSLSWGVKNMEGAYVNEYIDVTSYDQEFDAEAAKDKRVTVYGWLKQDKWDDKKTGEKRSKVKIATKSVVAAAEKKPVNADEEPF